MKLLLPDRLWKTIIREFFYDFVCYFYKTDAAKIDWSKGFEFLDKELESIHALSPSKDRRIDILAKVYTLEGEEQWMLIHVEVQGYRDENMALRVFQTYYRLLERFNRPISTFVIYTENLGEYQPDHFEQISFGTHLLFRFQTYRLEDYPPESLENSANPFAIILQLAWYRMRRNQLDDAALMTVKNNLLRKLLQTKYSTKQLRDLLNFIEHYIRFENQENNRIFKKKVEQETLKFKVMTIEETIIEYYKEEAMEEGLEQGKAEQASLSVSRMLEEGFEESLIVRLLDVTPEFIQQVREAGMNEKGE